MVVDLVDVKHIFAFGYDSRLFVFADIDLLPRTAAARLSIQCNESNFFRVFICPSVTLISPRVLARSPSRLAVADS